MAAWLQPLDTTVSFKLYVGIPPSKNHCHHSNSSLLCVGIPHHCHHSNSYFLSTCFPPTLPQLQQGLFVAFRENPEECQIIIKSDALRDCVQGERKHRLFTLRVAVFDWAGFAAYTAPIFTI
jgi:hypothetical protein